MASADKLLQRISIRKTALQSDEVTSFKSVMFKRGTQHNSSKGSLRPARAGDSMTFAQVWHLLHRVITAVAAILYCMAALHGSVGALELMRARTNPTVAFAPYTTALLGDLVGTTTVADSPLTKLLDFQVTPRNDTLYINVGNEDKSKLQQPFVSFTSCATGNEVDNVYANAFLRSVYDALVRDISYNLTFFTSAK